MSWEKGQRVTIDRRLITTIDRVTPTGRAIVNGRTFEENGKERGKNSVWSGLSRLEVLTPEIEAELENANHARKTANLVSEASSRLNSWVRSTMSTWNGRVPVADDVATAQRLIAAIDSILSESVK